MSLKTITILHQWCGKAALPRRNCQESQRKKTVNRARLLQSEHDITVHNKSKNNELKKVFALSITVAKQKAAPTSTRNGWNGQL